MAGSKLDTIISNLFEPEAPGTPGTAIYYAIFELFTAIYSIIYAWEWGVYILRISDVVLPLGLAQYIDVEIFFGSSLPLIIAALITVCVAAACFFRKARWMYAPAFLMLHLQYVTRFSLGEIPHSSNLVGFCLLGFALGGLFLDDRKRSRHFAMGFTIFFLGLGYTTAAASKLIATGITWVDGNHLWLWIAEKGTDVLSNQGSFRYNWVQEIVLQSRTAATVFLSIGLLTEALAFLMWWKRFRVYLFIGVIGLHMGIYFTMNILFLSYT
ncbi:MAG: hypothetical protein R3281_16070, partial [Balneolaceae bacterium]|nr:hypothetical protein [Balneolaceae bacterium]